MKRFLSIVLVLMVLLGVLAFGAFHWGLQQLRTQLLQSLGPRASVESIDLSWQGVELRGLKVRGDAQAQPPWPTEDELRVPRVGVYPAWSALWSTAEDGSRRWHIARVEVDAPSVTLLRTREGRLKVVPGLLEGPRGTDGEPQAAAEASKKPVVVIERLMLRDAQVEFFDASVRQPAHRMVLSALQLQAGPVHLPDLNQAVRLNLQAVFNGVKHQGRLQIDGTLTPGTRDADIQAHVHEADLLALQPYLLRVNEGGVRSGRLSMEVHATVKANRLHAPGTLTLTQLTLAAAPGLKGTFAGVSRQAVLDAMSSKGKIQLRFTLEGRLDDPAFSLNENLLTRLGGGLAETLGVRWGGVVEGVGNVIKGLLGR